MTGGKTTPQQAQNRAEISKRLKGLMAKYGKTQADIADGTGIAKSTLSGYVNATSVPTPGNTQKLSDYFDVKKSDIDPRFKTENTSDQSTVEKSKVELLAAHLDDDISEAEMEEITNFIEYIKHKNKK